MSSRLHRVNGTLLLSILVAVFPHAFACDSFAVSITVPGYANPWLAGMPDGSVAGNGYDTAPAESPILITGIPIIGGTTLTFSATGTVSHGTFDPQGHGPDGDFSSITSRTPGPENGIGDIYAPYDALLGVFLNNNAPNLLPPPVPPFAFENAADCDFLTLAPLLQQPFFIGDGQTSHDVLQQFIAPAGATRLFLGVMDSFGWNNNTGSFSVNVGVAGVPGDVNGDGIVNGLDISDVASHWLQTGTGTTGDANHDGIVNGLDISLIASHWLQTDAGGGGSSAALPEPSTLVLAVGIVALLAQEMAHHANLLIGMSVSRAKLEKLGLKPRGQDSEAARGA